MLPRATVPLLLLLPACKLATEPRFVSIDPDYAYIDGCTTVTLSGANLGTDAPPATIGGNEIEAWAPASENPDLPEHAQDVGFVYTGISPAGTPGFHDVVLTIDGQAHTLDRGFYYVACSGTFHVDAFGAGDTNAPGDTVAVLGCGIDVDAIEGRLYSADTPSDTPVATFSLVSDCRGAATHFEVPAVPDGTYWVELVHTDGTAFGGNCFDADPDTDTDTDSDTGVPCDPPVLVIDTDTDTDTDTDSGTGGM